MKEYIEREALMAYAHQQPSGFISDISIQFFPAADVVERKRGEWETTPTYVFSRDGAVLNRHTHRECGYHYRDYLNHGANFCPNCGDDMRSHQNILCDQAEAELTR